MFQTICFDVLCLENVLLRNAFSGPQPPLRAADFGMKSLLWRHLATSVTMPLGPFSAFLYTMAQSRKLPSFSFVSNSGQIWRAVQNGEKSNLPVHCSLRTSPACNKSLTGPIFMNFFHTIFCCRFPLCSLGNTPPPPHLFWGGGGKISIFWLCHF